MKLASLKSGRDGRLTIVSHDLTRGIHADDIAPTLQYAIDNWDQTAPRLQERADILDHDNTLGFAFNQADTMSPLPRAYQWADGSAYVNHVELVRKARGAHMPEHFWREPLMYQGGSDSFLGPYDPIPNYDPEWGLDFEGEIAIITNDVPMGIDVNEAAHHICLVMLVNDISLRNLIPDELAKGFGFFQSKPSSAFSPVAVTPDSLGICWREGKLHRPLVCHLNDTRCGAPEAGIDMVFNFPQLIAHAAKTRPLCAGTIIGSGTVSNVDRSRGWACIAEARMLETIDKGRPVTPYMKSGDTMHIEMYDTRGQSIFGAIHQTVK